MQVDTLKVGDVVCDCRFKHLKVIKIIGEDAILEDGAHCSIIHCLDRADHSYGHPVDTGAS
jgi:hypothetical protein